MICFFVKSSLLQSGFNKMYKPTDTPIQIQNYWFVFSQGCDCHSGHISNRFDVHTSVAHWPRWFTINKASYRLFELYDTSIFQHKPISLQYSWLSVEQPIRIDRLFYKHHWEFPINKKIIPMLTCPIEVKFNCSSSRKGSSVSGLMKITCYFFSFTFPTTVYSWVLTFCVLLIMLQSWSSQFYIFYRMSQRV